MNKGYYYTEHWKEISKRMKEQRPYCEQCGIDRVSAKLEKRPLQAHHKNYFSVGNEQEEDIEILCKECHSRTHGKEL